MRFKLDENLPIELTELFRRSGHDAQTVFDEGLAGAEDAEIASVCVRERRAIVTLDMDFADIRAYPPPEYAGIVVFRLDDQARDHVLGVGSRFLRALSRTSLDGRLWIVEESRIRVRE